MGCNKSPLERQVHEGVQLELHKADLILNSKAEWNHDRIPRIIIETGGELVEDKESGMSETRRDRSGKKIDQSELEKRKDDLGIKTTPVEKRKDSGGNLEDGETVGKKRMRMQALEEERPEVGADRKGNYKKKLQVKKRKKKAGELRRGKGNWEAWGLQNMNKCVARKLH